MTALARAKGGPIARRTFEGVLREDPSCAIAYWGIALDLLNNSLAVVPPRADAEAAWAALEKARAVGADEDLVLDRGIQELRHHRLLVPYLQPNASGSS